MDQSETSRPAVPVTVVPPGGDVTGRHRSAGPSPALRSRVAVCAVAAGAAVAAGSILDEAHSLVAAPDDDVVLLANGVTSAPTTPGASAARGAEPSPSAPLSIPADLDGITAPQDAMTDALHTGTEVNTRREIGEEQARRPKVVLPAEGSYTSKYEMRWGSFHGGIDLANAEGTPELAAMDGTVIDAGPAQGFGQWVRIMSDDGVMTVYGHMSTVLVTKGQRVQAGQQIARMGSQGFSTGSHLHFEVWLDGGKNRVDPEPWLRAQGVELPAYTG